jgi:hypothetical protein
MLVALAALAPRQARADDARTAAEGLFDDAVKRMAGRDYDRACPELEEVVRLQPGKVGALLELARCWEESGRLASASRRYHEAAAAAAPSDARGPKARASAAALASRAPALMLVVAAGNRATPGFAVQLDGRELAAADWDVRLPLDPGKHVLAATAPGKQRWTQDIDASRDPTPVRLEIPALADQREIPVTVADGPRALPPPSPARPVHRLPPAWAWVSGVAGLAALGAATGLGVDGLAAQSKLDGLCHGNLSACAGPGTGTIDPLNARKDRDLALFIGLGAAGLAAVTAGIVGLVRGRQARASEDDAIVVTAATAPDLWGVTLRGSF